MNAPTKPAELEGEHMLIELDRLVPSPTNPRKRKGFDEKSLNELAITMRPPIGILEPILVRVALQSDGFGAVENKGNYEIIAGERRWRAARIAGLGHAPCVVKNFTDEQVLQAQLIENKQREDLDELEEAEGYEKLLQQKNSAGEPYTVQMIADAMGVSKGTIYARMKLLDLCEKGRQALFDKKIDGSTALLIARVSPEKIQLEALQDITKRELSYRAAHDHIQRHFMLELKEAIFDPKDAALFKKAGSCDGCPKRTGNQPDLFTDVKSKDVCTDTVCFAMKKAAHFLIIRNRAEAEGATVISGKDAKKILPYSYSTDHQLNQNGYAKPNEKIPNDPKGRTWEQALKQTKLLEAKDGAKPRVTPVVIENPYEKGEIIQAINMAEAAKALRDQGYDVTLRSSDAGRAVKSDKEKAEDAKLRAQIKAENLYRERLAMAIHTQAVEDLNGTSPQIRPELFRLLADEVFTQSKAYAAKTKLVNTHLGEEVGKKSMWEANSAFKDYLETLQPQTCLLIMIDLLMAPEEKVDSYTIKYKPETLLALAAMHTIDAAALKKQAELEIKEEVDAKKKAKAATAKPAKKAEKPAAKKPSVKGKKAKPETVFGTAPVRKAAEWPFPTPI
jgi:ParB/RepB/Spo0J family partition protein